MGLPNQMGTVSTKDGVSLAYSQTGPADGLNILFVAGWCQSAAQWQKQRDGLGEHFCVTTYDHRGHGDSEKVDRGFRVSRLAADLHDLVTELDIRDVVMVGHSLGVGVIWSYWELFPDSRFRIKGLVLIDGPPCMMEPPAWSKAEHEDVGPLFSPQQPYDIASALQSSDRKAFVSTFLSSMLTKDVARGDIEWMTELNLLVDPVSAGQLLIDHAKNDYRDIVRTIDVPTLVIEGICPVAATEWTAAQIAGARKSRIGAEDGGSHFMFWENAQEFNAVVEEFVRAGADAQP